MSTLSPAVVMDVGANLGDWSEAVLRAIPSATVTSFEPIPDVAARCADRLAIFGERSQVVAVGLADAIGDRTFFIDPSRPTVSGLSRPTGGRPIQQPMLPFTTGDSFCSDAGIDSIDLLKVDAEGADHL
ncbi:MAG: FkbM family methyltransferase, partial [Ilumatobacteraceae bacterium]